MVNNKKLFTVPEEFARVDGFVERCNFLAFEKNRFETAKIIMNWTFDYFDRWIPAINEPILNFLIQNKYFKSELPHSLIHKSGNCGLSATVFNLFCHLSNIPSRGVNIYSDVIPGAKSYGHTLCEAEVEDGWFTFDPSVNVYFKAPITELAGSPEKFYENMGDEGIDESKWWDKRLWSMCNEQLYANITKIEQRVVSDLKGQFSYEDKVQVTRFDNSLKPEMGAV